MVRRIVTTLNFKDQLKFLEDYISISKKQYYDCLAKKLNNLDYSPKTYWAIMKTFCNGKKIPLIPPYSLVNDKLECDFGKKANHFNEFFCIKVYVLH